MEMFVMVKFKTNHIIPIILDDYRDFIQKLSNTFKLSPTAYHQLSYITPQGQTISITNTQGFIDLCRYQSKPTLTLQKTKQPTLHFDSESFQHPGINQRNEELQQMINQIKQQAFAKMEEFKAETRRKIQYELKQKKQTLKKRVRREMSGTVHNGIACHSCKVKEIMGVRYECAICDYNICEICQQEGYEHDSTHPFIKIKDQTQMLAQKNNQLKNHKQQLKQKPILVEEPHISAQLVRQLMELLQLSQAGAITFIRKYPTKDLKELVDIYFNQS